MADKILITGATGVTGRSAIRYLLERNLPVRGLVHRVDDRARALETQGVEIIEGDLLNFNQLDQALQGITAAYYLYPIQVPGLIESTAYFAQAAKDAGVKAIVNMSQAPARRASISHASLYHWIGEEIFNRGGIPVTHLKPTFFAEWLLYTTASIKNENRLIYPFGEVAYAPISGEDQGRVIATILADPAPHAGQTYHLYGPEELTQHQIAALLSDALGRTITYTPVDIPAFETTLRTAMRASDHFVQHILAVAQDCRDGYFSGMNHVVEELTGKPPMKMAEFIAKNRDAFL